MKERSINLDIIRVVAIIAVIGVHFIGTLNTSLFVTKVDNLDLSAYSFLGFAIHFLWRIFLCCVPLFLLLTGFLMNKKELSKKYYKSLIRIIGIYVLASIACILFKIYYLKQPIVFIDAVKQILGFSGAPYSWYVELYIGLFLIIPFLNVLYNSLKTKKSKQILIKKANSPVDC